MAVLPELVWSRYVLMSGHRTSATLIFTHWNENKSHFQLVQFSKTQFIIVLFIYFYKIKNQDLIGSD